VRVIYSDKNILVIAPYAATAPFGAWLIPRRHEGSFSNLNAGELDSLATALGKLAARLDAASMSFNWFLANSLPHEDHHFVLKVEPRDTTWGGTELGTGIVINPVPPEYAALWYKGKV
jgi:UDPglucose--hexose-1-phosphate uridylyltransferase